MNNISTNKKQLNDYLSDFKEEKKVDILEKFDNFDFDCGKTSFVSKMKKIIGMPKFGKKTRIYWTSRGWSEEEALSKRIRTIKDPETSPMNINFWIKKGYDEKSANFQVKSQRKMNKEYWIKRGFSEKESINKSSEFQKKNSKKFHKKLNNDKKFKDEVNSKRSNNINYWLNLGFNIEESKKRLSERQHTFSLEKCIEKYGKELGEKKWQKRQDKWQKSLKSSEYNGKDNKDSSSIDFFKSKYGKDWIEPYIRRISFKDNEKLLYLTSFKNYKEMIDVLLNDGYKVSQITHILKYKVIQELYDVSENNMKSYLEKNYKYNYRTVSFYKNHYENWVDRFIEENTFRDKDEIRFLVHSFNKNYKHLIEYMVDNYGMTDIMIYLKGKLLPFYYNTSFEKMFDYITDIDPCIKSKFGRMRYFNNHLCRSDGEYIISKFLSSNNIPYEYEKRYKNSLKRCDFYLPNIDLYIEYTGMDNIEFYKNKYKDKENYCIKNNINSIFSSNIKDIKNIILKEIKNDK